MKRLLRSAFLFGVIQTLMARERVESGVSFNVFSRRLASDPYSIYGRLREKDPMHRSRLFDGWVVSRHADVDAVLRDHRRFGNDRVNTSDANMRFTPDESRSMLYRDPPDHTRLRSLVSQAFTPRSVDELRSRIEKTADELLDALDGMETFDVIDALAYPMPVIVIAEMLGIPPEDRDEFRGWSDDLARSLEPLLETEAIQESERSMNALHEYLGPIVERRRADPRDDLVSALTQAEDEGDKLTHEELLLTLVLLLVAGNETTKNLVGNGLLALLRYPDELAKLREDPELIAPAIEELLRYDSPVQIDGRTALEDVELGGRRIERGQFLMLLIGSANRDPDVFDDPDTLDVRRNARRHIAFGRGIHHCLGAPLARIEGEILFRKLLERYPDVRLAAKPRFRRQIVLRGVESLPVRV